MAKKRSKEWREAKARRNEHKRQWESRYKPIQTPRKKIGFLSISLIFDKFIKGR